MCWLQANKINNKEERLLTCLIYFLVLQGKDMLKKTVIHCSITALDRKIKLPLKGSYFCLIKQAYFIGSDTLKPRVDLLIALP